jgi:hypothetical protein
MKIALLVTLFVISLSAEVSAEGPLMIEPDPLAIPSIHEQIKADRAKARADEENGTKTRSWDRDADGRRPWDPPREMPPTKK